VDEPRQDAARHELGAGALVAIVLGALGMMALAVETASLHTFEKMFADFGGSLPGLTEFVLKVKLPAIFLGASVLAMLGGIVLRVKKLDGAIELLVVGVMLSCGGTALCLYALYLPVFTLADSIK
jgi:type II secretory pathway component PulF